MALNMAIGAWGRGTRRLPPRARAHSGTSSIWPKAITRRWLEAVTTLAVEGGLISAEEARTLTADPAAQRLSRRLPPSARRRRLPDGRPSLRQTGRRRGSRSARPSGRAMINPAGHTRLPRYVRGRLGPHRVRPRRPRAAGRQRPFPGRAAASHSTASPSPPPSCGARRPATPSASTCGNPILKPPEAPETPFEEPWQAQAFALTVDLHARGAFSWNEWARPSARPSPKRRARLIMTAGLSRWRAQWRAKPDRRGRTRRAQGRVDTRLSPHPARPAGRA